MNTRTEAVARLLSEKLELDLPPALLALALSLLSFLALVSAPAQAASKSRSTAATKSVKASTVKDGIRIERARPSARQSLPTRQPKRVDRARPRSRPVVDHLRQLCHPIGADAFVKMIHPRIGRDGEVTGR